MWVYTEVNTNREVRGMNQLERDYLLAQSVIKSLEQENARLKELNRKLTEEIISFEELTYELVGALKVAEDYFL